MATQNHNGDKLLAALADLHEAVGTGFERVDQKFAGVDDRFEKVDRGIRDIRDDLDHMHVQLGRIEALILKDHERRLGVLEKKLGTSSK